MTALLPSSPNPNRLTPRELAIIRLVCDVCSDKEIGDALSMSHATVRSHLSGIFDKLWLRTRLELMLFGLANPELLEQPRGAYSVSASLMRLPS